MLSRQDLITEHMDVIQHHAFTCTMINIIHSRLSINNQAWCALVRNYNHIYKHYVISDLVHDCSGEYEKVCNLFIASNHEGMLTLLRNRKSSERRKNEQNDYKIGIANYHGYNITRFITRNNKDVIIFEDGARFKKVKKTVNTILNSL